MRFYLNSIFFGLILIFTSCVEESEITFNEVEISPEGNSIVSINIPKAEGEGGISSKINTTLYNAISKSLSFGEEDEGSEKSLEDQIQNFNEEYFAFKKEFPESTQEWEAQIDGDLMYRSNEVISIALSSYINTGGAHGILTISFLNFDTETGLQLENEQLFNDMEAVKSIAQLHFNDFISENEKMVFELAQFSLPQNIGFEEEGIVMLYNVYEVAPYASGIIQFTIPYDEISSYLNYN